MSKKNQPPTRAEVLAREAEIRAKVERELFGREISKAFEAQAQEAATHQCSEYHSAFTGTIRCKCRPLRVITYIDLSGSPVSGDYCARHAIELRRREAKGELEIMADEPLYPMPFDKATAREIGTRGYYGV